MLTLWMLACGAPPQDFVAVQECVAYSSDADLLAACVIRSVLPIENPALALPVCDTLPGPRRAECRGRWVNAQSGFQSLSREVLLDACEGQPDCAFDALDARPQGTYADQVAACEALAGRYVDDCAGHAAQRLLEAHPTDEAILAAMHVPHADRLRMLIPTYMAVSGRTQCPDIGPTTAMCNDELQQELVRQRRNTGAPH
jgi:hypothetical protein